MRIAVVFLCVLVVCSCAQTRSVTTRVYEDRRTEVALRRTVGRDSSPLSKNYSHPAEFEESDLKFLLSSIRYQEKGFFEWSELRRVFSADELYRIAPHLVKAFAEASPDDEIVFGLKSAKPGVLFASERFTNGTMFVRDKKLNCLFSNLNIKPGLTEPYDANPRKYYAGQLWRLDARDWHTLVEGDKGIHYNWIELDIEQGLAKKRRIEEAYKRRLERRQTREPRRKPEEVQWEDWEPDEIVEEEKFEPDEDVYFPPE